jgi:hypothetical protein
VDEYFQPDKTPDSERRNNIAQIANVSRLTAFSDLSLIGDFAERFAMDPDIVYSEKSFDTVINFSRMWKEQSDYQMRYLNIDRMMNESTNK